MFRKVLAKYYKTWYQDCMISAEYCALKGDDAKSEQYLRDAEKYRHIIDENKKTIEFFSVGDRAFLYDEVLPKEFRGYE